MDASAGLPRVRPAWSAADRALLVAGLAGAVGLVAWAALVASRLPDRVPIHFGFTGRPDAWGSPSALVAVAAVALVLVALLLLLARYPHAYNYLWPITPENATRQYALARRLVLAMAAVVAWSFLALLWRSGRVAIGTAAGLGAGSIALALGGTFAVVLLWLVAAARQR